MKFRLFTLLLFVTSLCTLCGLIGNINRNFSLLGELSGNYTRMETACYFACLQGTLAGAMCCLLVFLLLVMGKVHRQG